MLTTSRAIAHPFQLPAHACTPARTQGKKAPPPPKPTTLKLGFTASNELFVVSGREAGARLCECGGAQLGVLLRAWHALHTALCRAAAVRARALGWPRGCCCVFRARSVLSTEGERQAVVPAWCKR